MCFLRHAAVVCLLVGLVSSADAVTYGEPDDKRHPYVGLILFFKGGQLQFPCTGTLVAPRVVLTAGHCAFDMDMARVWFDDVVSRDMPPPPSFGTPVAHPEFDPAAFSTISRNANTWDIGVVLLDTDVEMSDYGVLPAPGYLNSLPHRGPPQTFTVVGYGLDVLTPLSPLVPPEMIERRLAESMLVNLESALTDGFNLQTSGHPGRGLGSGGVCKGDSGGPVLMGDTNLVVGIISFGQNGICRGPGFSYRTDSQDVSDFLAEYLSQ